MKTTADATISVEQLTAKFKTWQLYTQLLEYIRQGKNRIYDLSHRVDGPLHNQKHASCRMCVDFLQQTMHQYKL